MTNFVCILGWRFVGDFKRFLDTLSLFWRMRDRVEGGKSFCHFDVKKSARLVNLASLIFNKPFQTESICKRNLDYIFRLVTAPKRDEVVQVLFVAL